MDQMTVSFKKTTFYISKWSKSRKSALKKWIRWHCRSGRSSLRRKMPSLWANRGRRKLRRSKAVDKGKIPFKTPQMAQNRSNSAPIIRFQATQFLTHLLRTRTSKACGRTNWEELMRGATSSDKNCPKRWSSLRNYSDRFLCLPKKFAWETTKSIVCKCWPPVDSPIQLWWGLNLMSVSESNSWDKSMSWRGKIRLSGLKLAKLGTF